MRLQKAVLIELILIREGVLGFEWPAYNPVPDVRRPRSRSVGQYDLASPTAMSSGLAGRSAVKGTGVQATESG